MSVTECSADSSPVVGAATVAIDGRLVRGTATSVDPGLGLFTFLVEEESVDLVTVPDEGATVRIRWDGAARFDAEAEVVEVDEPERWVLSMPVGLDDTRRRQADRVEGDGVWSFVVDDDDNIEVDVFDLSADGVGLVFESGCGVAGAGCSLSGTLVGSGLGQWAVTLETTHVRRHPDDERSWIVGCRMDHINDIQRQQLAQALRELC